MMQRKGKPDSVGQGRKSATTGKWAAIYKLDNAQIKEAVARDPDAAPVDDDESWENSRIVKPVQSDCPNRAGHGKFNSYSGGEWE